MSWFKIVFTAYHCLFIDLQVKVTDSIIIINIIIILNFMAILFNPLCKNA